MWWLLWNVLKSSASRPVATYCVLKRGTCHATQSEKVAFASRKQYAVYAFVAVWIGSWHQTNTDDTAHCMKVEHTHSCWKLWKCYRYGTSVLWCDCVESKNFYSRTAILIGWIAHSWKSGNSNDRIPHVHTLTIIIHNSTWSWQRQSVWAIPL